MATLALLLAQSGDERAIGLLEIVLGRSRVGLPQMLSDKEGGGEIDRTPDQVGQTAWEEADAICHSAEALIRSGQMTEASRVATQALEAAGNIKERYGRLVTKIRASQILASSGQKESALTELNKVEANLGKLKTPWEKVHTILSLAQAFDQIGEREQVLRLLAGLEPEVERYSGVASRVSVLCEMIELFASAGNLEHALELADHAETLAARISSGSIAAWEKIMAFGSIADALFKIHQPDPADRAVEQAVQVIEKIRLKGQAAKVQARLAQILARAGQNGRAADLARQAFDRALLLDPGRERDKWEAMLESVEALLLAAEHQEAFNMARQMANAIVTSGAGVYSQEWFTHSALYCLNMIVQALHQSGLNGQALEIWRMQFSDPARANRKDVLFAIEYGRPLLAEIAGEEMLREIEQAVGEAQSW
jgi:tetratricopeptide (TPR) repeat protein